MSKVVVIFGAGAIGRGLLGEVVEAEGWVPVFVDLNAAIVEQLSTSEGYVVALTGKTHDVRHVSACHILHLSDTAHVTMALQSCAFAATAVGGRDLASLAPILAAGTLGRSDPLNILVCENLHQADKVLTDELVSAGAAASGFACIRTSVERMVRHQAESIDLIAESDQSLFADAGAWIGPLPEIASLGFCADIDFRYNRKLYTNNAGHALLAYYGSLAECQFIHQAVGVPGIRAKLMELLDVASQALVRGFGTDASQLEQHTHELVTWRFSNSGLADPVSRVGRDPLRKLSPNERLVGLAHLLSQYDLPTHVVSGVIAAAMCYRDTADPESHRLAEMIDTYGPGHVLGHVCRFDKSHACYLESLELYQNIVSKGYKL